MQGITHRTIGVFVRGREHSFTGTSLRVLLLALALLALTTLAALFLSPHTPSASAAQSVPYKLNFQGRLTTSSGTVVADGLYNMQFKLYDTSTAGTLLWSETRETTNRVQVTNGLFSVQLGDVTALSPSLFNNASARYFEITQATPATANCSTAACATWESPMSPRQPMGAAAYAMNSDLLDGQDGSWYQDATNLTAGTVSSARLTGSYAGVTGTGALAAGSIANGFGTIVTANTIQGTTITGTTGFNSTGANGYQVGGTTVLTSGRLLQNVLGYTQSSGNATFNQNAANQFKITSLQAPTADMAQITNSGFPTVTAGVNGLQIDYFGGAAAVESGAVRLNVNPGSTSGGTWNGLRVTSNATGPVAGVTLNGAKFEGPTTQGAGTENALYFDTKWDNILNVAGTSVLTAGRVLQNVTTDASILTSGTITSARLTGSYTGITGLGTVTTGTWQGSTVAVQYGGTGINGSTAANGSLLIGNGTGYSLATLTAGTGISVTNSAGGITIGTTGGGSYVDLQATTPGTAQTGNINVTGTVIAGNKIGIGVSPSAALLHVQSNTDASTTMLALETGIHGGTRLDVVGTSNNESGLSLKVYRAGAYTERIAVGINGALGLQATSADGVGIGTASPSAKLHVAGDALFRNATNTTTAFQVQDAGGTSLFTANTINKRLSVNGGDVTYSRPAIPVGGFSFNGSAAGTYTVTSNNAQTATGDFNGDGYDDIASVGSSIVSVLINNSGSGFNAQVTYATNSNTRILVGDFSGDGKLDILTLGNTTSSLLVGNGDGTFQAKTNAYAFTRSNYQSADFNSDGKMDIGEVYYDSPNNLSYFYAYLSNGSTFSLSGSISHYSTSTTTTSMAIDDFNGDGKKDIAACENNNSGAGLAFGNGAGGFSSESNYSFGSGGAGSCQNVTSGDFNADGKADIALANWYNDTVIYAYGTGSATAPYFNAQSAVAMGDNTNEVTAVDLNADGKKDIVAMANSPANKVSVFISNGTGFTKYDVNWNYAQLRSYGDFNGDGLNDVSLISSTTTVSIYLNSTSPATAAETSVGTLSIHTSDASTGGIFIQGSTNQSVSLFAIVSATGSGLMSVDKGGNLRVRGSVQGGYGSPDYAENITASDPSIQVADVVSMDPDHTEQVVKSSHPYDATTMGVISTSPGFVTNATAPDATDDTQRPLALSGRVPVKVTNENGPLQPGDYLTSSSTPGYAMKATQAGQTIGRAMESFSGTTGSVLMFIDNSYYNPYDGQHIQGSDGMYTNLVISGLLTTKDLVVIGSAVFAGDITVNGHVITGGGAPTAAGFDDACIAVIIEGTDSAGTIRVAIKQNCQPTGKLATITFAKSFAKNPRIVLSPSNEKSAKTEYYKGSTSKDGFDLYVASPLSSNTEYVYDYMVIE